MGDCNCNTNTWMAPEMQLEARKATLTKLAQIQDKLFVPKNNSNDFGKYKYRTTEDILAAVKPLCKEVKCVIQLDTRIELVDIGENRKLPYIKAIAVLSDTESGYMLTVSAYAREDDIKKGMDASQTTGSATSYARKYALAGMFGIDNEKDQDALNTKNDDGVDLAAKDKKPKTKAKAEEAHPTISDVQINAINAELQRTGVSVDVILDAAKVKKLEDMTQADYVKIIARLNKTSDKED